jgi:hypothetical protein
MTPNETKFVAEMKKRLAAGKVPAPVFFEVGKLCGLKCKEVVDAKKAHFSDNVKGAPVKKSPPPKKYTAEEQLKRAKEDSDVILSGRYGNINVEDNGEAEPEHGIVKDDGNEFVWIASPELIASTEGMH